MFDFLGAFALPAILSGGAASALTQQYKKYFAAMGGWVLAFQVLISGLLSLLMMILVCAGWPGGWIFGQYLAAGVLGGLLVAAGYDMVSYLKTPAGDRYLEKDEEENVNAD
jgi:hypothetical protein